MLKNRTTLRFNRLAALTATFFLMTSMITHASEGWQKMPDTLTSSIEGYSDAIPGARGVGGIAVDRFTGDLYAGLSGKPFGLWRSSDGGETWVRVDSGEVAGGWVRPDSVQMDQNRPGRMAFFRMGSPAPLNYNGGPTPSSAYTLDGGETWTVFQKAKRNQGSAGWGMGVIDWAQEVPQTFVAQAFWRPSLMVSVEGKNDFRRNLGVFANYPNYNSEWMQHYDEQRWKDFKKERVKGFGVCKDAILLGQWDTGIERSTDGGANFENVSDFLVATKTPVFFDGKLYWGGEKGLLVSEDDGATWSLQGEPLPMIRQGPFFGPDANKIAVVTEEGIFGTGDAGVSWQKIAPLAETPEAWRMNLEPDYLRQPDWLRQCYAWDYRRGRFYVAGMASPIYVYEY